MELADLLDRYENELKASPVKKRKSATAFFTTIQGLGLAKESPQTVASLVRQWLERAKSGRTDGRSKTIATALRASGFSKTNGEYVRHLVQKHLPVCPDDHRECREAFAVVGAPNTTLRRLVQATLLLVTAHGGTELDQAFTAIVENLLAFYGIGWQKGDTE